MLQVLTSELVLLSIDFFSVSSENPTCWFLHHSLSSWFPQSQDWSSHRRPWISSDTGFSLFYIACAPFSVSNILRHPYRIHQNQKIQGCQLWLGRNFLKQRNLHCCKDKIHKSIFLSDYKQFFQHFTYQLKILQLEHYSSHGTFHYLRERIGALGEYFLLHSFHSQ